MLRGSQPHVVFDPLCTFLACRSGITGLVTSGKLRSGSTAYLQAIQDEINTSSQAAAIVELMFPNVRFSGSILSSSGQEGLLIMSYA